MNQSTAQRRATSLVGRLADCNTISMVTKPADGIAAAPTAAAIDVNLNYKKLSKTENTNILLDVQRRHAHMYRLN